MTNVLTVCRQRSDLQLIESSLGLLYQCERATSLEDLHTRLGRVRYEFSFVDYDILTQPSSRHNLPNGKFIKEAVGRFRQLVPEARVIIMCEPSQIRNAVKGVKAGAADYLTYPLSSEEILFVMDNLVQESVIEGELHHLRSQLTGNLSNLAHTKSPLMEQVLESVKAVSGTRATVLITGETGTGKNLVARWAHQLSMRKNGPFISVHCGAIPDNLIESELFGHEKGSFTSAVRRKLGKFEIANNGTIFLDEVGTLTEPAQIKLLQVLQERRFCRVGGDLEIDVDVRIIAATNDNLEELVKQGTFRKDLLYRLNVFPIQLPPLRERPEDIPVLVTQFLRQLNAEYGKQIHNVAPEVLSAFENYAWPGNIRELENILERAYIIETASTLSHRSFPEAYFGKPMPVNTLNMRSRGTLAEARKDAMEHFESRYLNHVLTEASGSISKAASIAGITTRQLHKLMVRHGLKKEQFKPHRNGNRNS